MPRVVHLDLDAFFVTVERQRRPALAGKPVVVGGGRDGAGRVVAASSEASERGVVVGQPLRLASALCPEAVFVPGELDAYAEVAELADEIARRFFARIEWTALDTAYLDGDARVGDGPLRRAVDALQAALTAELGLRAACGVAGTKVAARVGSRLARPGGLLCLLPGYDARFLAPLSLDLFPEVTSDLRSRLDAHGITTFGDLAALADDRGFELAGRSLAPLSRLAAGWDARAVEGGEVPRAVVRRRVLPAPLRGVAELSAHTLDLACQVNRVLRERHLVAATVTVRATDEAGAVHARTAWVPYPGAGELFLKAAESAVRKLEVRGHETTALSVRAAGLRPLAEQPALFGDAPPAPITSAHTRFRRQLRHLERELARPVTARHRRQVG